MTDFTRAALVLVLLAFCHTLSANNGEVAFAYPVKNLIIDGNVSDWPANAPRYPIGHYEDLEKKNRKGDASAYFMTAYDLKMKALYVAVVMQDDDYVRTPNDAHYTTHDLQVLYLDLQHDAEGSGVIAYELDEDHRKIVHQEQMPWYPEVRNASWDNVTVRIRNVDGVTTYEWLIVLPDHLREGQTIGFDYVIFDKDTDRNTSALSWGEGGRKFSNSNRLGDLVPVAKKTKLVTIVGTLTKTDPKVKEWPAQVDVTSTKSAKFRLSTSIDSIGGYQFQVPEGEYRVGVPQDVLWNNWFDLQRVGGMMTQDITVERGRESIIPPIEVVSLPKPDLIGKAGILHQEFSPEIASKVDRFVSAYQKYYDIPGVSIGLIKDGKLVYHQGYGVENKITQAPLREDAVFEAASITKSVFAYVMNRLEQRGDFDLSRPLYEQAPFPELEKYPEYKKMTGRHVLTHVSGLPNWGARMINEPGTKLGYSGEGFEYLKKVVAGGVGDHLPDSIQRLLDQEVLEPFGMTNTYFKRDPKLSERGVSGHLQHRPTIQEYGLWPGMAYSMHTNAKDFAPFAIALLERKGLSSKQAKDMFSYHTLQPEENFMEGHKAGFGLGIALRESPYGTVFGHGGNNGDFRCQFEVYDELKMGYIIFTNSSTGGPLNFDMFRFLVEGAGRPAKKE